MLKGSEEIETLWETEVGKVQGLEAVGIGVGIQMSFRCVQQGG